MPRRARLLLREEEATRPRLGVMERCWLRLEGGLMPEAFAFDPGFEALRRTGRLEDASDGSGEVSGLDCRVLDVLDVAMEETLEELGRGADEKEV
jgi:hypothetical protein